MSGKKEDTIFVLRSRKQYAMSYIKSLEKEWKNNGFCDVTLIAKNDGTRIKAHRLILAATNSYFKEKLSSNPVEEKDNVIEIEDITGNELKTLINYSYTGRIQINSLNAESLLKKAFLLQYTSIFKKCEELYIDTLNPVNCFKLTSFAQSHNCKRLLEAIKTYQKVHFADIIQNNEYLNLTPEEVYEFFSNRNAKDAKLEKKAFKAAMGWTKHDQTNRENFLPKLLTTLKLNFIGDEFLEEALKAVGKSEESTQIVKAAMKNKVIETGNKLVIRYENISIYCLDKKSVEKKIDLNELYADGATVLVKDKIYSVGSGMQMEHGFWSINLKNGGFAEYQSTLKPREQCSVVELNGDIYAIGSFDDEFANTAEKFDAKLKRWKPVNNMLKETIDHASAVLKGKIFVVGGSNNFNKALNTVQCFNPETNSWSLCKPMLQERSFFTMVATDNYLFVFGGRNKNCKVVKSIEKYDSEKDLWTEVSELTNKYEDVSACLVENKIIVVGAYKGNNKLVMEEFNPETNECKLIGNLPITNNNLNTLFVHFYEEDC